MACQGAVRRTLTSSYLAFFRIEEPEMQTISRILLVTTLLLTAWTALGLTSSHARAEPPSPCFRFAVCQ
jgi:hypothetical protein